MQSNEQKVELTEQELRRLVEYFDVLIAMHTEYQRDHKGVEDDGDYLLSLHPGAKTKNQRNIKVR